MMFTAPGPRVYGLPPGVDFPARLVDGIQERLRDQPATALAEVTLFVNTTRMRRRVTEEFARRGATLLPRLRLLTDLSEDPLLAGAEKPVSALGRRLEVAVLIDRILHLDPSLAPRSALFDLADSLAGLMDEMRGEGVSPQKIIGLDVSDHSAHWARAQTFIALVERFYADDARPDAEARQRRAVLALAASWTKEPPTAPIIIAGSTGSRGTTALLMQQVALLPQGAVVLPGYDFDLPESVWAGMDDALVHEAHPQFRMAGLLKSLKLGQKLQPWVAQPPAAPLRNRLVSLVLRPAPVTDQWITDGPHLGDLGVATAGMALIEANSPRQEALAIALVLREAVEKGEKACLISPDRSLTRRVAAALDRWGLRPDDSAGQPLQQTAPGRLLRLTAKAMGRVLAVDEVMGLLKHPLTHSGADRGAHLKLTRDLELHLRRKGPAFPDAAFLAAWAFTQREAGAVAWGATLGTILQTLAAAADAPLAAMVRHHRALTEALSRGSAEGTGALWEEAPGREALAMMEELEREAPEGFSLSPADYAIVLAGVMGRREARDAVLADGRVEILGVQEARIQGADLVVLGGLTEGSWPETPAPDPWLNRRLRRDAGLLLPERRVGLSAHDFQIAVAAPRVVMTRAHRNAEAETVPSRWLNRLTNLLAGLPAQKGDQALAAMKARGERFLHLATALEATQAAAPAPRPSPRPPVAARPKKLSITAIERLVTDPYEIYARHVLKLEPLNPLRPEADFKKRGEVVHAVLERFLRTNPLPDTPEAAADLLMEIAAQVLAEEVPWPVARAEWLARMRRIALPFAQATLRREATPVLLEEKAGMALEGLDFTLTGKPDRIDLLPDGTVEVIDYKSGAVPRESEVASHRKQLHLAAVMVLEGAFEGVGERLAARITYQSMKPGLETYEESLDEVKIAQVLVELRQLISAYFSPETGFAARRAAIRRDHAGDYDHLSRFGEWTAAEAAIPEDLE